MIIRFCPRCRGEGQQTVPPYAPLRPLIPIQSREARPCGQCRGVGYLTLDFGVLKAHLPRMIGV